MTRLLGLLTALLAVAACGAPPLLAQGSPPPAEEPAPVGWTSPLVMVGWWRVEGSDQVVGFDPALVEVRAAGAVATGAWTADTTGRFLADIDATALTGGAPAGVGVDPSPAAAAWLVGATGYAVDGTDRVLTAPDGATTRLVPVDPPAPADPPGAVDPARAPTDAERRATEPAAPAPAGLVPAVDVTGRWVPEGGPPGPFAEFAADGAWTGSDGCNGTGGRYALGADGAFLAVVSAVSTEIGCDGVDVAAQLGPARRAVLDGAVLVLLDPTGAPVGRFVRG